MSHPKLEAKPQSADAMVNIPMQAIRNRLRPKKRPSQPVAGRITAFETR